MLPSVADVPLMCWSSSGALDIGPCLASAAAISVEFAIMKNSFLQRESLRNATRDAFAMKSRQPLDICTSLRGMSQAQAGPEAVAESPPPSCSIRLPIAYAFKNGQRPPTA